MHIEPCTEATLEEWVALRCALWPYPEAEHRQEAGALLAHPAAILLLARDEDKAIAFAEATLRHEYVNGCTTSPVAFLEGIYVRPEWRGRGVARTLCRRIEAWAITRGCQEFASDAWLDATSSHQMHKALGFVETERVVYFRKNLAPNTPDKE